MKNEKKKLYTRQVENLKRRLGQKRVSRWTENPKERSRQKLGMKSVSLCPIGSPCNQTSVSTVKLERHQSIQSVSDKQQNNETLKDIGEIGELEPNGIVAHSCFLFFVPNTVYLSFLRRCSLTRASASLYKNACYRPTSRN